MRILFLEYRDPLNPYVGGGDIYLNELAKGCARKGHSVTIIASRFSGSSAEDEIDGVHVLRIGSRFTLFIKTFLQYFSYLRGRFDVVVEEIMGGPRVPFFASIYMKEPIVGILQQKHREIFRHQFPFLIASFLSFLERFLVLLYRNKQLVVNSQRTKNELGAIGYVADNMHIVNPGLPPHFFETIGPLFSRRKPRVICLTKIRRYKLIDNAIRAMKMVCQNLPECQLVIAGRTNDVEPEYEIELRKLIADLDLGDNIIFKKDVSERQKIELLASSRALVLPSAIEGFGIVVTEANACGTPAIVSDRVPNDAAVDGFNSVVTPCFDLDSLSAAILFLVSNEEKWTKLSANSVEWAKKFKWATSVNKFLSVVNKCKQ